MLTTQQITDLAVNAKPAGRKGLVAAYRRFHLRGPMNSVSSEPLRRFLDAVDQQPTPPAQEKTPHPADAARLSPPNESAALTPSDFVWLQRLPTDPAAVTFADATQVASLAVAQHAGLVGGKPKPGINTSDQRLIDSIWTPIKELHDRRVAEADLADAQRLPPPVVPEVHDALREVIAREHPDLQPHEVAQRAQDAVREATNQRERARQLKITDARVRLQALDDAKVERQRVSSVASWTGNPQHLTGSYGPTGGVQGLGQVTGSSS